MWRYVTLQYEVVTSCDVTLWRHMTLHNEFRGKGTRKCPTREVCESSGVFICLLFSLVTKHEVSGCWERSRLSEVCTSTIFSDISRLNYEHGMFEPTCAHAQCALMHSLLSVHLGLWNLHFAPLQRYRAMLCTIDLCCALWCTRGGVYIF